MALSEHEQRMFDAIEQALFEDDPKFASSVNVQRLRRRRPVLAIVLALVGLVALVGGAIVATLVLPVAGIPLAVVGFIAMVAGVSLLVYGTPGGKGTVENHSGNKKVPSPLTSRMEERFKRRFDE
ncbi:MAG: DUF3040 domain-containing protein [Nakamurella sp.]